MESEEDDDPKRDRYRREEVKTVFPPRVIAPIKAGLPPLGAEKGR
jgi:hypothetical protein